MVLRFWTQRASANLYWISYTTINSLGVADIDADGARNRSYGWFNRFLALNFFLSAQSA